MRLAEALAERKAAQEKINELSGRLQRVVMVQEGEPPAEQPADLLAELATTSDRLRTLIVNINRTNVSATLADGRSVMAAIADRDVLQTRMGVLDTLLGAAGVARFRTRGSEIRMVVTVDVASLQRERDDLARRYRATDTAIQQANWTTDLIE